MNAAAAFTIGIYVIDLNPVLLVFWLTVVGACSWKVSQWWNTQIPCNGMSNVLSSFPIDLAEGDFI
jgi:hypothetical protein